MIKYVSSEEVQMSVLWNDRNFSAVIKVKICFFLVLTMFAYQQPLAAALSVCVINSTVRFAMFILMVFMLRGTFKIVIPWRSIMKYLLASAVMGAVLYFLPYSNSISTTLIWTAIGGVVYLSVLMLIDKETRALPKSILHELSRKKKD